jgi:hypothetical protein
MDVIVSPALGSTKVWNLTDRLGRNVGQIVRKAGNEFVILPANARLDAPLSNADAVQPSLDAAMNEIARHLKGACQLASGGST